MGKNLSQKCSELCIQQWSSDSVLKVRKGARQGNPLSTFLLIICVETLFVQVRNNDDIKGIRLGDNEIKLSAYADDADFLTSDVRSLALIFQTCETFQVYPSLKLYLEKSEACWIGAKETPINCKWIDLNCNALISWRSSIS